MSAKPQNVAEAIRWIENVRFDPVNWHKRAKAAKEYLLELEHPQETEAAKQPEVPPGHHVCFTRGGLVRWSPGLAKDCIWCRPPGSQDHTRGVLSAELARVAASRRRRQPKVCTCASVGGFSARCPVHGAKVDRTPL